MNKRLLPKKLIIFLCLFLIATILVTDNLAPVLGVNILLHPPRITIDPKLSNTMEEIKFNGSGIQLQGWHFTALGKPRGTIIYLHGVGNNRLGVIGIAKRFTVKGFDVIAYDSRAHGYSGGDNCTYGFYEKEDLRKVIDQVNIHPIILLGSSMGAAVSLQAASIDSRIKAVVAAETFADLRIIIQERSPFFIGDHIIQKFILLAEKHGNFQVDAVSPVKAAPHISVPVLLIHGALDRDTSPEHSQIVYNALPGTKKLLLVPGAAHNQSLNESAWHDIEKWIAAIEVNIQ